MTTVTLTQHKEFTLEVQLQLDRMWESWSRYDAVCAEAGYENDHLNAESDRLWSEYNAALKAAYRAQAQAEADEIVQRHGDNIRQLLPDAGFRQISRQLTAVSQAVQ